VAPVAELPALLPESAQHNEDPRRQAMGARHRLMRIVFPVVLLCCAGGRAGLGRQHGDRLEMNDYFQKPACGRTASSSRIGPASFTFRWPRSNTSRQGSENVGFSG